MIKQILCPFILKANYHDTDWKKGIDERGKIKNKWRFGHFKPTYLEKIGRRPERACNYCKKI